MVALFGLARARNIRGANPRAAAWTDPASGRRSGFFRQDAGSTLSAFASPRGSPDPFSGANERCRNRAATARLGRIPGVATGNSTPAPNASGQRARSALRGRQPSDPAVPQTTRLPAHGRANQSAARHPTRSGRTATDAAAVARGRGRRQNGRRRLHGADGLGERLQRRAHGADGGAGGTAR